jgi:hypothetical protein
MILHMAVAVHCALEKKVAFVLSRLHTGFEYEASQTRARNESESPGMPSAGMLRTLAWRE